MADNVKFCSKCGNKLSQDAKFCRFCGAQVPVRINPRPVEKPVEAHELRCPKCGYVLSANAKFCKKCGTAVGEAVRGSMNEAPVQGERPSTSLSADDLKRIRNAAQAVWRAAGRSFQSFDIEASKAAGEQAFAMSAPDQKAFATLVRSLKGGT